MAEKRMILYNIMEYLTFLGLIWQITWQNINIYFAMGPVLFDKYYQFT